MKYSVWVQLNFSPCFSSWIWVDTKPIIFQCLALALQWKISISLTTTSKAREREWLLTNEKAMKANWLQFLKQKRLRDWTEIPEKSIGKRIKGEKQKRKIRKRRAQYWITDLSIFNFRTKRLSVFKVFASNFWEVLLQSYTCWHTGKRGIQTVRETA